MSTNSVTPPVEWGVYKRDNKINYHFQNINGLKWSRDNFPLTIEAIKNMSDYEFNIVGLVETNTEWQLQGNRTLRTFQNSVKKSFGQASISTSASNIKFHTEYKPGGTATIAGGPIHTRVLAQGTDPELGRWSYITLQTKNNKKITFLNVYRVCHQNTDIQEPNNRIGSRNLRTFFTQQLEVYAKQGVSKDPRTSIIEDLKSLILERFYSNQDFLVLGIDANEDINCTNNTSILQMLYGLGLQDALVFLNGEDRPPTISGSSQVIDHILVSQNVLEYLVGAGQLVRNSTFTSDHSALFIQIDDDILDSTRHSIPTKSRKLHTKDYAAVEAYLEELRYQFSQNNIENRVKELMEIPTTNWHADHTTKYNKLDQHITRLMLLSEKKCSKKKNSYYEWSPELAKAGSELSYLLLIKRSKKKVVHPEILERARIRAQTSTLLHIPLTDLNKEIKLARKRLKQVREQSYEHRKSWLEALAISNDLSSGKDPNQSNTLRILISREEWRRRYKKCQNLMGTLHLSGLREIHVPQNESQVASNTVSTWQNITDPQKIIEHIIKQNDMQFSQARFTPLADTPLGRRIGKHGNTQVSEQILSGTFDTTGLPPEISRFLSSLMKNPSIKPFEQSITPLMFKEAFTKLSEKKSSSTSGRHIGHYKAATQCELITQVHCNMMNIPFHKGFAPERWTKVTDVMLEKSPGIPRIHRLRIIQIIEADLNQCLLLLFTRPMVQNAEKHNLLHPSQWSTRNQNCTSAVLSKILNLEYSRINKVPTAWIENDAKGCFDRIIPSLAVLNCRRYGAPKEGCETLSNIWNHLEHKIKTAYGISVSSYSALPADYHAGAGQGSCLAPLIWNTLSTQILSIVEEVPHMVTLHHVENYQPVKTQSEAYVDDTSFMINAHDLITEDLDIQEHTLAQRLAKISQRAERTLFATGGALELSKCCWYALMWKFDSKGIAHSHTNLNSSHIELTSGDNYLQKTLVTKKHPEEAVRTLGCYIAPNGSSKMQIEILLQKASHFRKVVTCPTVSKVDAYILYKVFFFPAISYPLGVSQIGERDLKKIETKYLTPTKQQMGLRKTTSNAILFASRNLGGFGFPSLIQSLEKQHLRMLCGHLRAADKVGRSIVNTMSALQLESGLIDPFLHSSYKFSTWVTNGWLKECWRIFDKHNLVLHSSRLWVPATLRANDKSFMQTVAETNKFENWQLCQINRCRMYLKVITLSDIATACGSHINQHRISMSPSPVEFSPYKWPTQSCPDPTYWKVWRSACRVLANSDKTLKHPLGEWLTTPRQLFYWEISSNGHKLYERKPDHAIIHLHKVSHRNSQRRYKEYTLTGQRVALQNIPHDTKFATIRQGKNSLQLLSATAKGVFNTSTRNYALHTFGQNFLQKSLPPDSYQQEFLIKINDVLQRRNICVHIKAAHSENHMGFCYEFLTPPSASPAFWYMNSIPTHFKDSSRTRSLQLSLANALRLINLCEQRFSSLYNIALSPTAWEELESNIHKYPTKGYSSLYKPHSDAYKVLENQRIKVRSTLYLLDTEDLLVEHEGKKSLPEYLESPLTKEEKETWKALLRTPSRVTIKDYPPEAVFLIEHERNIMGHIPEHVLQKTANDKYKKFLVKHTNIPEELFNDISWNLFSEAISRLNLAKLLPVLKFVNNEWCTGDKMEKFYQKSSKCPMCNMREDLKHVFSCNSPRAKQTRKECLYSIQKILSRSDDEFSAWWCSLINGSFVSLGASPVEDHTLLSNCSPILASQMTIGPLHLLQGRLHSAVVIHMQQMNVSMNKQILSLHLLWKMAATIWRTRNQALHGASKAERDYKKKTALDKEISAILSLLQSNQLPHRTVPLGYSFTIDSKQTWLRWEKMSLHRQNISITDPHDIGELTHATSTLNLGGSSQRTRSRKRRVDYLSNHMPT